MMTSKPDPAAWDCGDCYSDACAMMEQCEKRNQKPDPAALADWLNRKAVDAFEQMAYHESICEPGAAEEHETEGEQLTQAAELLRALDEILNLPAPVDDGERLSDEGINVIRQQAVAMIKTGALTMSKIGVAAVCEEAILRGRAHAALVGRFEISPTPDDTTWRIHWTIIVGGQEEKWLAAVVNTEQEARDAIGL